MPLPSEEDDGEVKVAVADSGTVFLYEGTETLSLPEAHWAKNSIQEFAQKRIIPVSLQKDFQPDDAASRQSAVSLLVRSLGLFKGNETAPFSDLSTVQGTAGKDIVTAYHYGIVNGNEDGRFAPERTLTRQEFATMMTNAWESRDGSVSFSEKQIEEQLRTYSDGSEVPQWARKSVALALSRGWMNGDGKQRLQGERDVTMAEAIVLLDRMID
ncbi:S-layer homology domain-containing protein [Aureibacillus halotolerans]|uniref:S-layer family protein n=1 Tax=Aureibacillus halotolerans TaxID=1508390 RepID=A0A4V3D5N9_9BACI|nr:S-layer homology domain-containing protein [Aureibacillus halotolerans]TDQ40807.1 S-layer family protein [Aureibacillus halotolerans]